MQDFCYKIVISGRPPAKSNCYGVRGILKGGKPMGVMYTKRELEEFEKLVGELTSMIIRKILDCPLQMEVHFYQYGKRFIDGDNILKAIGDGGDYYKSVNDKFREPITGGWSNDKIFWRHEVERKIAKTKEEERVEIYITPFKGDTNIE